MKLTELIKEGIIKRAKNEGVRQHIMLDLKTLENRTRYLHQMLDAGYINDKEFSELKSWINLN